MVKQTTKAITTREKAVVKWKGEQITVSFHDVKSLICPYATDQETVVFLKTCQSLQLNPFANEIYLIKYSGGDKAAMVIAIGSYLKSAETNDNFNGFEAGTVLRDSGGKLDFREGALILPDEAEKLVGGWARIYRKDRERPFYMAVNKAECLRYKRDGSLTKFWTEEKQPSMLRKTALKRALVEAFPSLFAGTMSTVEVAEEPEAEYEPQTEGELPPAYERNGEAYWKLWWARQKEKGLDKDKVHDMLGISSLKTDWLEQGRTLEEAEEIINEALEQRAKEAVKRALYVETGKPGAATPTKVKPKQTGWPAFWDRAEALGLSLDQVHEMLGVASITDWTDAGKTLNDAITVISDKLAQSEPVPESATTSEVAGEGFSIDLTWLSDSQKALKWTDDTFKTFLVSQYKVSPEGTLEQVIKRLAREQAEDLVNQINSKVEKQPGLI